ncbi:winged helix-turn-helix domain-containing protein [Kitasatospora phosalacinea]|uniref:Transcriptional regulator n=1 Tax=Kitasatospora phosalacinea TaxID=2065 RepID=A0A9W6PL58_9ACTN|nr:transcriptional regulator [Kitasatospora phosalacinea]GLW56899.1 transcriptional regulator [Kitasatospora phosalacinea]
MTPAEAAEGADAGQHPAKALDDTVHQRIRLGILTVAHQARRAEFGFLRTTLDLTAGNLGQHLTVLEKAGLVAVEKGYEGRRPRTWITLTPAGERALREEVAQLKRLIHQIETADGA